MTRSLSVLWLDNDVAYMQPFVMEMADAGIEVTLTGSVLEAEEWLRCRRYDALLIDVMVPVSEVAFDSGYDGGVTDNGYATGLVFYRRNQPVIDASTFVLVLTVRMDRALRDSFVAAGLPAENFSTKYEMSDPAKLADLIRQRVGP